LESFDRSVKSPGKANESPWHPVDLLTSRPHHKGTHHLPQVEGTRIDFSSPYVKHGKIRDSRPSDYVGSCIKPDAEEPDGPTGAPPRRRETEREFKTFSLLKGDQPFDPKKHTVAVFDDFKESAFSPNGPRKPGLSHGDITAVAAQQAGFNVLRLQYRDGFDTSAGLNEIKEAMKNGDLPLKSGDAINASFGRDRAWKEVSCLVGMKVTPENYASKREEMVKRLHDIATGKMPVKRWIDGATATMAAATQEATSGLQALGITVVNAAGNHGNKKFDLDFANANIQLSATDRDGKPVKLSANHALTTAYQGVFELRYDSQHKAYKLDKYPIYFPEQWFGGKPTHRHAEMMYRDGPHEFKISSMSKREKYPVALVFGTSFSNATYWAQRMKELQEAEQGKGG
jgi:hypothetical protein